MAWRSLHQVLGSFEQEPTWNHRQQFQRLLAHWPEVVGTAVAAQTRPIALQRDVLQVATSSSVWAQNLMFERQRILDKLNSQLSLAVKDIRFSTAHWYNGGAETIASESQKIWQQHPSRTSGPGSVIVPPAPSKDATTAFQAWAGRVRSRAQHLPLCPDCRCPTPEGELRRWSVCSLCAAKAWAPGGDNASKDESVPDPSV
ncbi:MULTISPECIES: DUF721 domain-containing protein [unclassified Leptolyngbya]|uniref:DUF721 domain-containing protein n=1 Tax=unclassified Leptolyngbya TaxID=2650499 RepID=UPI001682C404|nr:MULTISPECIES: DUF721 domain-containing protein [unclassified Leptolyngbya]MBD1910208.1 DUF721 domain-containing protein [Leptolyngbya sp. FACHB-8]MBD2153404.1 DUF721 domain-containing protein [Leptolyngbya sp. FACHB-16]